MSCCGRIVSTVARGAIGISKSVLPGIPKALAAEKQRRRDICWACEHGGNGRLTNLTLCSQCRCNIMLKTRVKDERCPLGCW